MNSYLTISDSLINGLCREIEYIRQRSSLIKETLSTCKDQTLKCRLVKEIKNLKERQFEVMEISNDFNMNYESSVSKMFLFELCRRSLEINK